MKLLLVLAPLLSLVGCLPGRLVPYDFAIEKDNIESFIEMDSITISIENLEAKKSDHYVFGLQIRNNTTKPFFVNMNKIRKHADYTSYYLQDEKEKLYQEIVSVMTPIQVHEFFKTKVRNAESAALFFSLVGATVATYEAIKDQKDRSKEYWDDEDEKKHTIRKAITSVSLISMEVLTDVNLKNAENARVEFQYLPEELFDRKIIYPGETYYGKILFKRVGELHKYHRISYPIDDCDYHFDFRRANRKEKRFLYERDKLF